MVKDIVTGVVAAGLSLFAYVSASAFEKGGASLAENPALYPRILSGVVFCFGLALILQALLKFRKGEKKPSAYGDKEALGRVGKILAVLFGYAFAIYLVGFIVPTLAFTCITPLVSGSRLKTAFYVSLPLTAALYVVFFIFFKVPIPHGIVFG
jgi:hypothetical protein